MTMANNNSRKETPVNELVRLLHSRYQGRSWPTDMQQLKKDMTNMSITKTANIANWLFEGTRSMQQSQKWKVAAERAIKALMQPENGYLGGTKKSLVWNFDRMRLLINNDMDSHRSLPSENVVSHEFKTADPIVFIDNVEKMNDLQENFPFNPDANTTCESIVAIACEGVPENLFLVQVGTSTGTYVFDGVTLGEKIVCQFLAPLLGCSHVTKLFHDLHHDAFAFARSGGIAQLVSTLDFQLAIEYITGDLDVGFNKMLQHLGQDKLPLKQRKKSKVLSSPDSFSRRPLPYDCVEYAALNVGLLLKAKDDLFEAIIADYAAIQRASDTRVRMAVESGGARQICFDSANDYAISSLELLSELRPNDVAGPTLLQVSDDTNILLQMLPDDFRSSLEGNTQFLSDIVLDQGREPLAWIGGKRFHLSEENRLVSPVDIANIVEKVGGFGGDNRAGLEQQLHRISAIRNRQEDIIGLTLRVGRHVSGNANMISDLLFADKTLSILFMGEPGSGKTTVVREVTKQLAEQFNVCIVDTSNEIAGDGDVPHPCVGYARRMMVPSLDKQSSVMIECVQNHTPGERLCKIGFGRSFVTPLSLLYSLSCRGNGD